MGGFTLGNPAVGKDQELIQRRQRNWTLGQFQPFARIRTERTDPLFVGALAPLIAGSYAAAVWESIILVLLLK